MIKVIHVEAVVDASGNGVSSELVCAVKQPLSAGFGCRNDGIRLLRPSSDSMANFDYEKFSEGDFLQNRSLAMGDVVFAPRHTLAEIGWVFRQLQPIAQLGIVYDVTTNN